MRVSVNGVPVNLTPQEYRLFNYLMHHAGRVVLHSRIGGRRIVDMLSGEQLPRIC